MDKYDRETLIVTAGIVVPIIVFLAGVMTTIALYNQGQKDLARVCIENGKQWVWLNGAEQCVDSDFKVPGVDK
jgi:hypothetical protein